MKLHFVKMEGCGNDYIYIDCFGQRVEHPEKLAVTVSDRHFGIGGDGLVLIEPSGKADAKMRMFNMDGSESPMCGNAIRCVGKYLYERGHVTGETVLVETLSGMKSLALHVEDDVVVSVRVDMGQAVFGPEQIPVLLPGDKIVARPIKVAGEEFTVTCVSMGNPHCVIFVEDTEKVNLEKWGPSVETADIFPVRTNVEFVQVLDSRSLRMRVWERGSGETLACGTGACAAAVAAVENGLCAVGEWIRVELAGGALRIRYDGSGVMMEGPAHIVFEGDLTLAAKTEQG